MMNQEQWVECEWTPPENIGQPVWLCTNDGEVVLGEYIGCGFYEVDQVLYEGIEFSHWMIANIPEPPQEET